MGEEFGEVFGVGRSVLGDLFGATEAVGDDGRLRVIADGGQQDSVSERLRNLIFVFFEAEGPGHAAAAGVEQLDVGSSKAEQGDLVGHPHSGAVMAVAMDENLLAELRRTVVGRKFDEKFAEKIGLVAELAGPGIVRKKVGELVAEDARAGGFEDDDRDCVLELRGESVEGFEEVIFGGREHAEVVEGPATTEVFGGQSHAEAGGSEDLVGGAHGGRVEVVVEGVGPEEDLGRFA